jgi:hypothetical protein
MIGESQAHALRALNDALSYLIHLLAAATARAAAPAG